jgi:hypothetical protein
LQPIIYNLGMFKYNSTYPLDEKKLVN